MVSQSVRRRACDARLRRLSAAVSALSLALCWTAHAYGGDRPDAAVHTLHVQGKVYLLWGAGGHVTVQAGDDGVLVVDTGSAAMAKQLLGAIRGISNGPIRYIIDTHFDREHIGGNEIITRAGQNIVGGREVVNQARILSFETLLADMITPPDGGADFPPVAWPTDTYFTDHHDIFFNGEPIRLMHMPSAVTHGDTIVRFISSNVISAGDVFRTDSYPVIDLKQGGTINGVVDALNRIIDMMIPEPNIEEGGTMVIGGHGRVSDRYSVNVYRDMLTIIRDRVKDMKDRGMSLDEVQAARPSRDYDGIYGSDSGGWTTQMFIDAVYQTLGGE